MLTKYIKSPLRYPGGKSKLLKYIVPYFPDNFDEYIEPFLGGASSLLYVLQQYKPSKIIVNDLYSYLFIFWKQLKENYDQLYNNVYELKNKYTNGKDLYNYIINKISISTNDLEIATLFFILNRITFSGILEAGGYSQESYEKRFTISSIERLKFASSLLKNVEINNDDYSKFLYNTNNNTFIYLDPPYYSVKKLYGKKGILQNNFNHITLYENLKNCNHKWCLSYDDSNYIRDLYSNFYINKIEVTYGMRNSSIKSNQKESEIIIRNYK